MKCNDQFSFIFGMKKKFTSLKVFYDVLDLLGVSGGVFGFMMRSPLRRGSKSWKHVTSSLDCSSVEFEFSRLIDISEKPR